MTECEASRRDSLLLIADGESAVRAMTDAISRHGSRVLRSFDLRSALTSLAAHECECPHHGTEQCDCQSVVLPVYCETPPWHCRWLCGRGYGRDA